MKKGVIISKGKGKSIWNTFVICILSFAFSGATHIAVQEHECSVSDIAALVSAEMRTDQDYTIMDIKGVEIHDSSATVLAQFMQENYGYANIGHFIRNFYVFDIYISESIEYPFQFQMRGVLVS